MDHAALAVHGLTDTARRHANVDSHPMTGTLERLQPDRRLRRMKVIAEAIERQTR